MVALDADREVLRPAKLWNDTESAPEAAALVAELGAQAWAERCGSVPVAAFTIAKLAWLRAHEPDVHARLSRVLLPHDWLTLRLTGEVVTDRGDASGTGYWSPTTGEWCADLLDRVGLGVEVCPELRAPTEPAGRWRGAVVGPGTGDNMAAALGMGLRPGDVAVSIGTSGVVSTVADAPVADPTGAVAGLRRRHRPVPPPGVHAQRGQGDRCDGPAAGRGPRRAGRPRPGRGPRSEGRRPRPLPRRRAHPQPARRHRQPARPALRRDPGPGGPGRVRGRGVRAAGCGRRAGARRAWPPMAGACW